jgi:hypothetical protein
MDDLHLALPLRGCKANTTIAGVSEHASYG